MIVLFAAVMVVRVAPWSMVAEPATTLPLNSWARPDLVTPTESASAASAVHATPPRRLRLAPPSLPDVCRCGIITT